MRTRLLTYFCFLFSHKIPAKNPFTLFCLRLWTNWCSWTALKFYKTFKLYKAGIQNKIRAKKLLYLLDFSENTEKQYFKGFKFSGPNYRQQEAMDSSACPDMSQMTITHLQWSKINQHFYWLKPVKLQQAVLHFIGSSKNTLFQT